VLRIGDRSYRFTTGEHAATHEPPAGRAKATAPGA
jgi:hypothetical protein